jgi:6-phosphogluconolactonase (cycloisomerase 2 family)
VAATIPDVIEPASLADYLELMTRAVFQAGVRWKQIAEPWEAYCEAFSSFDPDRVAAYGEFDVERVLATPGILRTPKKVRATIANAAALLQTDREYGGLANYLASFGSYEALAKDFKKRFKFMGDMNVWYFLFRASRPVPHFESWVTTIPASTRACAKWSSTHAAKAGRPKSTSSGSRRGRRRIFRLDRGRIDMTNSNLGRSALGTVALIAMLAGCGGSQGQIGGLRASNSMLPGVLPEVSVEYAYVGNYGDDNISAYKIASDGSLTAVKGSPFAAGTGPTAMAVDPTGKFAYAANTGTSSGGNVSAYTIDATTGALTAVKGSPFSAGTEPSGVAIDPTGKFAYVSNYGDNDVDAYTIDATTGALTAVKGSPFPTGEEPEYVAIDPKGKFAYVPNYESNSVSAYAIESDGALKPVKGSPFAAGTETAGATVNPSGKFVYAPNYGADTVSAYTIESSGALKPVKGSPYVTGSSPTNVVVDPNGKYAYVVDDASSNVSAYAINATSGALTQVKGSPFTAGTGPEYVAVDPAGKFAYVPNVGSDNISAYAIESTGALKPVKGSPFTGLKEPAPIVICRVAAGKCVPPPL